MDTRTALDPLVARRAAENGVAEHDALRRSVDAMEEAIDDEEAFRDLSVEYHELVAESSGNPVLIAYYITMQEILRGYTARLRHTIDSRSIIIQSYRKISDAILASDGDRAESEAARHIQEVNKSFARLHSGHIDDPLCFRPDQPAVG
jgi:DNA-binding FadR family transcriptional regulator